mmetsp:Transcript_26866/g.61862  ORF Transcript_26866/g.61862 Transcript_26866/m.61862 type:complete len:99 (-) Transcript_26866:834-1130(-)
MCTFVIKSRITVLQFAAFKKEKMAAILFKLQLTKKSFEERNRFRRYKPERFVHFTQKSIHHICISPRGWFYFSCGNDRRPCISTLKHRSALRDYPDHR